MNGVEPLVPFHSISDFKPLEELFVGNLCGFCYSQSLTQFLKFIVRDNTHKRVQNTAEVGLVNQTVVVVIKLIKCCTQILKQRKMYRSNESFCEHFLTILNFFYILHDYTNTSLRKRDNNYAKRKYHLYIKIHVCMGMNHINQNAYTAWFIIWLIKVEVFQHKY